MPVASISRAPVVASLVPTSVMRPSLTARSPLNSALPNPSAIRALRMTRSYEVVAPSAAQAFVFGDYSCSTYGECK